MSQATKISREALSFAISSVMAVAQRHRAANLMPAVGSNYYGGEKDVRPEELVDFSLNGKCTLSAVNTDQVNIWVDVPVLDSGLEIGTAIVASTLDSLIKTGITSGEIIVSDDEERLLMKGDDKAKHKVKKHGLDRAYLDVASITTAAEFTGAEMLSLLRSASCVSDDEARYVLQSILLDLGPAVKATAADGFRAGVVSLTPALPVTKPGKLLLPPAFADALQKLVKKDHSLSIGMDKRYIKAEIVTRQGWHIILASPLMDGNYPDVASIMKGAEGNAIIVRLSAKDFQCAIKRTKIFAPKTMQISLVEKGGILHLAAQNDETGSCDNELGVTIEEGFNAAFNANFLLDFATACTGEIEIRLVKGVAPALLTDNAGYTSVIMPMVVG